MQHNRFDQKAAQWDEKTARVKMAAKFVQMIIRHVSLSPSMRAMEFGCGTGLVSLELCDKLGRIDMVDDSEGMIDVVRQKAASLKKKNMIFCLGDIFQMDFEPNSFALIYTMMALHHVPDTDAILNRFHELLKPGGFVCIGDLCEEDGSFHDDPCEVHYGFNTEALQNMLEKAGFCVVVNEVMHTVEKTSADGVAKKFPLFFMKAIKQ